MEVSGQINVPAALPPGPGTHWIGGFVGHRAGLHPTAKRKILSPYREPNPDRPPRSLVTIPSKLFRIFIYLWVETKFLNIN
jgi:hypothetical protein